jgi:hypothetical protein
MVIIDNKDIITTLSRPAIFLGSIELIHTEIVSNIQYPQQAREIKKQGRVIV